MVSPSTPSSPSILFNNHINANINTNAGDDGTSMGIDNYHNNNNNKSNGSSSTAYITSSNKNNASNNSSHNSKTPTSNKYPSQSQSNITSPTSFPWQLLERELRSDVDDTSNRSAVLTLSLSNNNSDDDRMCIDENTHLLSMSKV